MTICDGCNQPIHRQPVDEGGGDWYASCEVCEWHCEGDERTTIKQGLSLEELVAHKKNLNRLYDRLYRYNYASFFGVVAKKQELEDMLSDLREIMEELLQEGE